MRKLGIEKCIIETSFREEEIPVFLLKGQKFVLDTWLSGKAKTITVRVSRQRRLIMSPDSYVPISRVLCFIITPSEDCWHREDNTRLCGHGLDPQCPLILFTEKDLKWAEELNKELEKFNLEFYTRYENKPLIY